MEKINWIDRVRNEEVLQRVKEERNIHQTLKGRKANWIGHILRRNCLLKHVIEGKIKKRIYVTGIGERRRKHLPDELKGKTGYCKLEDEALERSHSIENSLWKRLWTCRKTNSRMNEWIYSMNYTKSVFGLHFTILNLIQSRTHVSMLETQGCIRYELSNCQLRKELVLHRVDEL